MSEKPAIQLSSALQDDHSEIDGKTNVAEKQCDKDATHQHGLTDKLQMTKRIVIRKTELMANQYDNWFL